MTQSDPSGSFENAIRSGRLLIVGIERPIRGDIIVYIASMLLLILVGVLGMVLHVYANLVAEGVIVTERFLRGAPFLAPLLFANMGTLGLMVLLDPAEAGTGQPV